MEKNVYFTETTLSDRFVSPVATDHTQYLHQRKLQLNQQTHLFIVLMGMVLGTVLASFMAYHLNMTVFNGGLLLSFPVLLTYMLRKIYIHTLVHTEDEVFDFN